MTDTPDSLTEEEKAFALRIATNSMQGSRERWAERIATGLTDQQLARALEYELGSFGSRDRQGIGVTFQGSGLRIWADRCMGNRSRPPILEGQRTVSFARRIYGISDPDDRQLVLF